MRVNSILLIPGAGHGDGQYSRGQTTDLLCEADVVDSYLMTMAEILDEYDLRHEIAPTRKPPGLPAADRLSVSEPGALKIELSVGYFILGAFGKPRARNESTVEYNGPRCLPLAELLCEALSEWGRCASYGHRVANPIWNQEIAEGCLRIRPFAINGVDAEVYAARCGLLGRDLGLALVYELGASGEACRGRPIRA